MHYPKISIITPSFNQGDYLEETILSVIGQNYPNLEYIIIDGGSTDNSVDIIKKYEKYLVYWISEKDSGMYDAIQKGFYKSTGEIMAWINSDDWYFPKAFFSVAEIFASHDHVDWIQGITTRMDEKSRIVYVAPFRKWSKYNYLMNDYEWIQQESCFWRRTLWKRAGGKINTSLKYAGDFELWLRFFDYAQLHCVDTSLGSFRARSKNQFSVDRLDEYKKEANHLLVERLKHLSPEEKKQLNKLYRYKNFSNKIPGFRTMFYPQYINNFQYPPQISFDRGTQTFVIK